jgi:FkbM family methyltransferase
MLNTEQKIKIARMLFRILRSFGAKSHQVVSRGRLTFDLDLNEGIDLSLFLFGYFQKHILQIVLKYVPEDGIVFDVGANIGALSIPIAQMLPKGHVYSFEPTDFAFTKLLHNISLNPAIANRISPVQVFVVETIEPSSRLTAYSSWNLFAAKSSIERHPVHQGIAMPATKAQTTLDHFATQKNIGAISLIKIDTDGHEFAVLKGARLTIERFRPIIVFEATEFFMKKPNPCFEDYESFFDTYSYRICEPGRIKQVSAAAFRKKCGETAGYDLVAMPIERLPQPGQKIGRHRS